MNPQTEQTIDIVALIEKNASTRLTKTYQNSLLNKIKNEFNANEQQLFVASFYCYLNYDQKKDFIINFDDVWKWCGFSRKDPAKRLLEKFFTVDVDYKVGFPPLGGKPLDHRAPPIGGASINPSDIEISVNQSPNGLSTKKEKIFPATGCAGLNKENILITVNTFKKFCLKSGTKKADQIHDYYIKLEEVLQDTLKEQSNELQKQLKTQQKVLKNQQEKLEEKEKVIEVKSHELTQTQRKLYKVERTNNMLKNKRYYNAKPGEVVYLFKSTSKNQKDLNFKIGRTKNMAKREDDYARYNKEGRMVHVKYCLKSELIENVLLHMLEQYRNISSEDWFTLPSQEFGIKMIDTVVHLLDSQDKEELIPQIYELVKKKTDEESSSDLAPSLDENNGDESDLDENVSDIVVETVELSEDEKEEEIIHLVEEINPRDFDKFVSDCFEVNKEDLKNYVATKSDINHAHRMWSRSTDKDVLKELDKYLYEKFHSGVAYLDNMKRNVYRGLKLKPLSFTPSSLGLDYEQFTSEKCKVDYSYEITFIDYMKFFTGWKKEKEPDYVLKNDYKQEIMTFLRKNFTQGRISTKHSQTSNIKSEYILGVYGLGISELCVKKLPSRPAKKVGKFDVITNELIKTFESTVLASNDIEVSSVTLSSYIKNKKVLNDRYIYNWID